MLLLLKNCCWYFVLLLFFFIKYNCLIQTFICCWVLCWVAAHLCCQYKIVWSVANFSFLFNSYSANLASGSLMCLSERNVVAVEFERCFISITLSLTQSDNNNVSFHSFMLVTVLCDWLQTCFHSCCCYYFQNFTTYTCSLYVIEMFSLRESYLL